MKIVIIVDKLKDYYGLENNILSMVKIWSKTEEVLIYVDKLDNKLFKEFKGVSLISKWTDTSDNYIKKSFKPDILLNYCNSNTDKAELLKNKIPEAKLYTVVHTSNGLNFTTDFEKKNEKFIVLSKLIKEATRLFVPLNKIKVIYSGINMKEFYPTKKGIVLQKKLVLVPEFKTLAAITRIERFKEIPLKQLIKVSLILAQRVGGLNLLICGDGEKFEEIKEFASKVESEKLKILFTGQIKNVRSHMNLADVVVGSDRVALEAILCNKKVFYMGKSKFKCLIQTNNFEDIIFSKKGFAEYSDEELTQHLTWVLTKNKELEGFLADLMEKVTDCCDSEIVGKEYLKIFKE